MADMQAMFLRFSKDTRGATALEYGLIVAVLSMAVATATATIGTSLVAMFQRIVDLFA